MAARPRIGGSTAVCARAWAVAGGGRRGLLGGVLLAQSGGAVASSVMALEGGLEGGGLARSSSAAASSVAALEGSGLEGDGRAWSSGAVASSVTALEGGGLEGGSAVASGAAALEGGGLARSGGVEDHGSVAALEGGGLARSGGAVASGVTALEGGGLEGGGAVASGAAALEGGGLARSSSVEDRGSVAALEGGGLARSGGAVASSVTALEGGGLEGGLAQSSASAMSDELFGVVRSGELTVARLREAAAVAPKAAWTAADEDGCTPLHHLMSNKVVTAEMVRAVGEVAGAAAWGVANRNGYTPAAVATALAPSTTGEGARAHVRSPNERATRREQQKRRRHSVDEDDEAFRFQIEAVAPDLARKAHMKGRMYAGIVLPGIVTLDVLRVVLHRCSRDDVFRLQAIANVQDAIKASVASNRIFTRRQKGHLRLFLKELNSPLARASKKDRERLCRPVRDAILQVKWPVAPDIWASWDCVGETIRVVSGEHGHYAKTFPAQLPPDPAAQQASWPTEAVEAVRLLKAELARLNAQKQRWAPRVKKIGANVNKIIAQHSTATFAQCEVCNEHFSNLAQHQIKVKHGQVWEERQKETGSAKKRRLAAARKESYHRKRLCGKLDRHLKPKNVNTNK